MPKAYAYVIEELITEKPEVLNKEAYYNSIVNTIIDIEQAEPLIIGLCELIQRLVIDHLHIIGDIFDRGPSPHKIMDRLMKYHSVDVQWGNHDILWMGAAAGQLIQKHPEYGLNHRLLLDKIDWDYKTITIESGKYVQGV